MTEQQIEASLKRLEEMPDEEFRQMCADMQRTTRERIRDRQRSGMATSDDLQWLFEHAA